MNPRIKCSLVLLLLIMLLYAGTNEFSGIGKSPLPSLHKRRAQAYSRKLMGLEGVLDYDYAGPNPKHDPRGKKGGGGSSKNP